MSFRKIMKYISILILLIFATNCASLNQKTSSQKKYLNEVFEIVEKHSIRKDSVNLKKIKKEAYKKLKYTNSIEDCYPIVKSVLKDLGDNHSFLMTKEEVKNWRSSSKFNDIKKTITFSGKRIEKSIGYIKMKAFISGDAVSNKIYADSLQNLIKTLDSPNIKGWILDLRENNGGNCWPMLAGIGPLLGNGTCGYFLKSKNKKSSWFYLNGECGIDKKLMVKISNKPYKLINDSNPIAILTGKKTASSGEVVVTAFHSKNNTRSFGKNTAGLSTGNARFKLSDGSTIFITASVYADRNGTIFGNEIKPDEKIEFTYQNIGQPNDLVLKRALKWINEK